jgi:hypothetical protein
MGAMEMYARINGWYRQHVEFMLHPDFDTTLGEIRRTLSNGNKPATEDNHVRWVYQYYLDCHINGHTRRIDLDNFVFEYERLQAYRFPVYTFADHASLFEQRLREMRDPVRVIGDIRAVLRHREWHRRQTQAHPLHRAILHAWEYANPADEVQLVMEWPHASKQGEHMIAYTRDEKYGEADRVMTTPVAKYLARHFPKLASNVIRDIAARYVEAQIGIVRTLPEMLEIIENGPSSCMSGKADEFNTRGTHPYAAYDPQYGWHMAYVKEGAAITGRALLNDKTWVRTYRRDSSGSGYSQSDDRLNVWLRDQGYSKADDWEGFKLARIEARNNCGFIAPYLDGSSKDVDVHRDHLRIVGCGDGEYTCSSTNGDAEAREDDRMTCEDCDDRMYGDDTYHVYRNASRCVCTHCYENNYTRVIGRSGNEYAVDNDDAIEVNSTWYDINHLEDNEIVQLHDGEYCHRDDAVFIDSVNEYYPSESDDICYTKAGDYELKDDCVELADGEWCLTDDAWQCEHSGDYYEKDVDSVTTKCGKRIHEDYADEYEIQNDDETVSL